MLQTLRTTLYTIKEIGAGVGVFAELSDAYSELPPDISDRLPVTACVGSALASRVRWLNNWSLRRQRAAWARSNNAGDMARAVGQQRERQLLELQGLPTNDAERREEAVRVIGTFVRDVLAFILMCKGKPAVIADIGAESVPLIFERLSQDEREREYGLFFLGRLLRCMDSLDRIAAVDAEIGEQPLYAPDGWYRRSVTWLQGIIERVTEYLLGRMSAIEMRERLEPLHRFRWGLVRLWLKRQKEGFVCGFTTWQFNEAYTGRDPERLKREATLEQPIHAARFLQDGAQVRQRIERWFGYRPLNALFDDEWLATAARVARVR